MRTIEADGVDRHGFQGGRQRLAWCTIRILTDPRFQLRAAMQIRRELNARTHRAHFPEIWTENRQRAPLTSEAGYDFTFLQPRDLPGRSPAEWGANCYPRARLGWRGAHSAGL